MFRISPNVNLLLRKRFEKNGELREMATLKAISIRLKSVKNIQKITQSMKMVSAAKYARAERELKQARPLGDGAKVFHQSIQPEEKPDVPKKTLYIAVTSDRGLCGAVHSSVAKIIRSAVEKSSEDYKVICVGDKSRSLLQRLFGKNILLVCQEVGRLPPTFSDASALAIEILQSEYPFDIAKVVFNRFRSVVSYVTEEITFYNLENIKESPSLKVYEDEEEEEDDEDTLWSYVEFSVAALIFYAMKEGACSEQSSRMTAMDNASKNASEMISKLTLTFNRTRQAVITRELIEIISGASAL